MAVQEIWMPCINIAGFHRYQIPNKLIGGVHNLLEKVDHDLVEFLFQPWISAEKLLSEELGEDSYEFVINQGDTFQ
jgi:hypothetical protein